MLEIDEKPKRKNKQKRLLANSSFIVMAAILVIIFVLGFGCMVGMEVGVIYPQSQLREFDVLSTQIAATNDAVATQVYQTQIASTPSP
jgi:hypothetical protein